MFLLNRSVLKMSKTNISDFLWYLTMPIVLILQHYLQSRVTRTLSLDFFSHITEVDAEMSDMDISKPDKIQSNYVSIPPSKISF